MQEVAEGVPTAQAVVALIERYELDLPIFTSVAKVLNGTMTIGEAIEYLTTRPLGEED
jgi:glycerol-3-phosphate dehydrogenase